MSKRVVVARRLLCGDDSHATIRITNYGNTPFTIRRNRYIGFAEPVGALVGTDGSTVSGPETARDADTVSSSKAVRDVDTVPSSESSSTVSGPTAVRETDSVSRSKTVRLADTVSSFQARSTVSGPKTVRGANVISSSKTVRGDDTVSSSTTVRGADAVSSSETVLSVRDADTVSSSESCVSPTVSGLQTVRGAENISNSQYNANPTVSSVNLINKPTFFCSKVGSNTPVADAALSSQCEWSFDVEHLPELATPDTESAFSGSADGSGETADTIIVDSNVSADAQSASPHMLDVTFREELGIG